jgi:hypothetical protein
VSLKQLSENPVIRVLAVIVLIAAGIRLVLELLAPVFPYLVVALVAFAGFQVWRWYARRW